MWNQEKNIALFTNFMTAAKDFELSLDSNHEAVLKIVSTNGPSLLATSARYVHPNLVCFEGTIDGQPATSIMHISQLNLTIIPVPITEERPKRIIGFRID